MRQHKAYSAAPNNLELLLLGRDTLEAMTYETGKKPKSEILQIYAKKAELYEQVEGEKFADGYMQAVNDIINDVYESNFR